MKCSTDLWVHDCFSKAAARPWKCSSQPSLRRLGGSSKIILILVTWICPLWIHSGAVPYRFHVYPRIVFVDWHFTKVSDILLLNFHFADTYYYIILYYIILYIICSDLRGSNRFPNLMNVKHWSKAFHCPNCYMKIEVTVMLVSLPRKQRTSTDPVTAEKHQHLQGTRHWEDHPQTFSGDGLMVWWFEMVGIQLYIYIYISRYLQISPDISRFQLANSLFWNSSSKSYTSCDAQLG